jgi:hypothetical protein
MSARGDAQGGRVHAVRLEGAAHEKTKGRQPRAGGKDARLDDNLSVHSPSKPPAAPAARFLALLSDVRMIVRRHLVPQIKHWFQSLVALGEAPAPIRHSSTDRGRFSREQDRSGGPRRCRPLPYLSLLPPYYARNLVCTRLYPFYYYTHCPPRQLAPLCDYW